MQRWKEGVLPHLRMWPGSRVAVMNAEQFEICRDGFENFSQRKVTFSMTCESAPARRQSVRF